VVWHNTRFQLILVTGQDIKWDTVKRITISKPTGTGRPINSIGYSIRAIHKTPVAIMRLSISIKSA